MMELLITLAIAAIIVFIFIAKSYSQKPSSEKIENYTIEQLQDRKYKINRQLAKLGKESNNITLNILATSADMQRADKIQEKILMLENEMSLIENAQSKISNKSTETAVTLNRLIIKHVVLVELLIEKKGFTEEQANNAILNKINDRQRQYQEKGMSEEQALEKAGADIYSIIDKQI